MCFSRMWWRRREREGESLADLAEALTTLRAEVKGLGHEVDDLHEVIRRMRGRKGKTEAIDAAEGNGAHHGKTSVAQLRAAGRLPPGW